MGKIFFAILLVGQGKKHAIAERERADLKRRLKRGPFGIDSIITVGEYDTETGSMRRTHPEALKDSYIKALLRPEIQRLGKTKT